MTYAELEAEATWVARRLAAFGVRRDGIAALTMSPRREEVVLLHALMKLGAVALPLSPQLTEAERSAVLAAERPAVDLNDAAELTQTEADLPLLGEHDMDDLQCRILTSGTSGAPRPVDLTYGNFLFSAVGSAFNIGVEPEDRWLCCLPLSHVAGLSIILRSVIYGTTAVLLDGFDTEQVASTLVSGEISLLSLVPTQLNRLLEAGADLSRPRAILIGGGPVPEDALRAALDRGATVVQTWPDRDLFTGDDARPGGRRAEVSSAGRPLLTSHVRIEGWRDPGSGPTRRGPPSIRTAGSTRRPRSHRRRGIPLRHGPPQRMIVTGGENVMPAEVEAVLLSHPAVADAAVLGRPDPEWQEAVCALVVAADGNDPREEELRTHCSEALASYKVPKQVDFVSSLPRTGSGKLLRGQLPEPAGR